VAQVHLTQRIYELGFHVLFSDADVSWMHDPLPYLKQVGLYCSISIIYINFSRTGMRALHCFCGGALVCAGVAVGKITSMLKKV
jgi:hypothetical protein